MRKQFDLTRMMEIFRQIIEKIELSCDETLIKKTLDGKCLVCLSEGLCWEFLGRLGGWRSSQKSWAVWAYNQATGQQTDLVTWWEQIERVRLWSGGPCVRSFKTPLVTCWFASYKKAVHKQAHGRACVYRRQWECPLVQHSSDQISLACFGSTDPTVLTRSIR